MKGYKVFNNDWTCKGFKYEVGREYHDNGTIEICERGFHFCEKLEDCFNYYPCVQWNKIAEIEALGEVKNDASDSKKVTNHIKIIREIDFSDIKNIIASKGINASDGINNSREISDSYGINASKGINYSEGINNSRGINDSRGISDSEGINNSRGINYSWGSNYSEGINNSRGINYSNGINASRGINYSEGINNSRGINDSWGINYSEAINNSRGINYSWGINYSEGINNSRGINYSWGINYSEGINNSRGINDSWGISDSEGLSKCIFCFKLFGAKLCIFNKIVSNERFSEVRQKLDAFYFYPQHTNAIKLYQANGETWEKTPCDKIAGVNNTEAWADMPSQMLEYIKSLEEFDAEIFFKITGIKI